MTRLLVWKRLIHFLSKMLRVSAKQASKRRARHQEPGLGIYPKSLSFTQVEDHIRYRRTERFVERAKEARQRVLNQLRGLSLDYKPTKLDFKVQQLAESQTAGGSGSRTSPRYGTKRAFEDLTPELRRKRERTISFDKKRTFFEYGVRLQKLNLNLKEFNMGINFSSRTSPQPPRTNLQFRLAQYKWNTLSTESLHEHSQEKLHVEQKLRRQLQMDRNRGLDFSGYLNTKVNLGNFLDITSNYDERLDQAKRQKLVIENGQDSDHGGVVLEKLNIFSHLDTKFQLCSITGAVSDGFGARIFENAQNLTQAVFQKFGCSTNLNHTEIDDFTTWAIIDDNENVIAVLEYVIMKGYVWIESLCVAEYMRNHGLGNMMINRLVDLGKFLKKDLLLFSLVESWNFYQTIGFVPSPDFPFRCTKGLYCQLKLT
jgi:N-acetylglutamate synthase-like GNAT family acetyltransferase